MDSSKKTSTQEEPVAFEDLKMKLPTCNSDLFKNLRLRSFYGFPPFFSEEEMFECRVGLKTAMAESQGHGVGPRTCHLNGGPQT